MGQVFWGIIAPGTPKVSEGCRKWHTQSCLSQWCKKQDTESDPEEEDEDRVTKAALTLPAPGNGAVAMFWVKQSEDPGEWYWHWPGAGGGLCSTNQRWQCLVH